MKRYGLIGKTLKHSFSPDYFSRKFSDLQIDATYSAFELASIHEVSDLLKEPLNGLNVTIPYKTEIIPFLDQLSNEAKAIGAVNTIAFKNGKTWGFNTDAPGFWNDLKPLLNSSHNKALIFGTGGASKAVQYALSQNGIDFKLVSRSAGDLTYPELEHFQEIKDYTIWINTTPIGMYPEIEKRLDLPYSKLTEQHVVYDLVYNPEETLYLKKAKEQRAITKNGLGMLINQAEESYKIWTAN